MKISDQCNTIGVLPTNQDEYIPTRIIYNDCTQIYAWNEVNNGNVVIYTVSAGKTLYLTNISCHHDTSNTGYSWMALHDDSDVQQHIFYKLYLQLDTFNSFQQAFNPPMEIPAGYTLKAYAQGAPQNILCAINGWEK